MNDNNLNCISRATAADQSDQEGENARLVVAELIDLLDDERSQQDTAIVTEIIKTVHLLVKEGGLRRNEIITHPQLLIFLSQFFHSDHHLTRLLASLFHDLSTEEDGIRLLLATGIIPILLQSLESFHDDVINFVLTTLRHCLIEVPTESAEEIQLHNGCMICISLLLRRNSNRQMNFLADCLLRLALFNTNAQIYLQTSKLFLQELVAILDETNYNKLSLTLIRMLPFLSSNVATKPMLVQFNLIPVLERTLKNNDQQKIQRYCLLTLRNLSDQIIHMENFDSLIITLIEILASKPDVQMKIYIVDILSNLSCENQANKSLIIHHKAIPLLVEIITQSNQEDGIIESAICTLRHLTGKCLLANQAREDLHLHQAIAHLAKYLLTKQDNWSLLKVCIGLLRNLALSRKNIAKLCEYRTVYKIGQLFSKMKSIPERHELFLSTLFVFARQHEEKYRTIVEEEIVQSGCIQMIVLCTSRDNPDRIQQMAHAILDDLHHSDDIEHRTIVQEAEKSHKIVQFLQSD